MKCLKGSCGKGHHELPDILIPNKMHTTSVFEKITEQETSERSTEDSTISRMREWFFTRADALMRSSIGLYTTLKKGSGIELLALPRYILDRY